jgi:hypothetical protein
MAQQCSVTTIQIFTVGRHSSVSAFFWNARIDDLRVYNTAVSGADVARIYNEVVMCKFYVCTSTGSGFTAGNIYTSNL